MDNLTKIINHEWTTRYDGEPTADESQLCVRVKQLAADRDCWMENCKATEKDRQKLCKLRDGRSFRRSLLIVCIAYTSTLICLHYAIKDISSFDTTRTVGIIIAVWTVFVLTHLLARKK